MMMIMNDDDHVYDSNDDDVNGNVDNNSVKH